MESAEPDGSEVHSKREGGWSLASKLEEKSSFEQRIREGLYTLLKDLGSKLGAWYRFWSQTLK